MTPKHLFLKHLVQNTFGQNTGRFERIFGSYFRFIVFAGKIVVPMTILLPILKPDMPMFLTSLASYTKAPNLLTRVVFALPWAYMIVTFWSNMMFLAVWLLAYSFSTLAAIQGLM